MFLSPPPPAPRPSPPPLPPPPSPLTLTLSLVGPRVHAPRPPRAPRSRRRGPSPPSQSRRAACWWVQSRGTSHGWRSNWLGSWPPPKWLSSRRAVKSCLLRPCSSVLWNMFSTALPAVLVVAKSGLHLEYCCAHTTVALNSCFVLRASNGRKIRRCQGAKRGLKHNYIDNKTSPLLALETRPSRRAAADGRSFIDHAPLGCTSEGHAVVEVGTYGAAGCGAVVNMERAAAAAGTGARSHGGAASRGAVAAGNHQVPSNTAPHGCTSGSAPPVPESQGAPSSQGAGNMGRLVVFTAHKVVDATCSMLCWRRRVCGPTSHTVCLWCVLVVDDRPAWLGWTRSS